MKYQSKIIERGEVSFPSFMAERVYMREFRKDKGLPSDLSRWQTTVDQMLDGIDTDDPIYIMIDQSVVTRGKSHRREGIHIDGYWNPGVSGHGTHQSAHGTSPGGHNSGHKPIPHHHAGSDWGYASFEQPEGLILASDLSACVGYVGEFEGPIGDGGDCSHVDLNKMNEIQLNSGRVYAGNVTCLHESVPIMFDCERTLVRLNVPGWTV